MCFIALLDGREIDTVKPDHRNYIEQTGVLPHKAVLNEVNASSQKRYCFKPLKIVPDNHVVLDVSGSAV